jgi:hypothetical protein
MFKNSTTVFVATLIAIAGGLFASSSAYAIPSFTRQTGMPCTGCHTVFPELNSFGRQFKLRGYTLGAALDDKQFPENLPLGIGLQVSDTSVKDRYIGTDPADFPQSNKLIVQQLALYYGGKIAGNAGAVAQYNYDGIEKKWLAEMVDVRYADSTTAGNKRLLYGVTVSNSPTTQDVWNSSAMWAFPHIGTASVMPMQTSLLDMTLANQVGNVGLYGFYDNQFYAEIGFLHNGRNGIFRALNLGTTLATAINGNAPHLRLAWEKNWDSHSFMIGGNAVRADIFPDATVQSGPTDRFTDVMLDGQYQYDDGDRQFSLTGSYDREKRSWDASFPAMNTSNPSDNLYTFRLNGHYWYQRKIGGGIGFFDYRGDTDVMKYGMGIGTSATDNASGSPNTRGWIAEANWLPLENRQNVKLGLRYTAYTKFNGASTNYNGGSRNASDNDSLFAYLWMLY